MIFPKKLAISQPPKIQDQAVREAIDQIIDHSNRILDSVKAVAAAAPSTSGGSGGDPGAPAVSYNPISTTVAGGVLIDSRPAGAISTVGHYEWYWSLTNVAPAAATPPTFPFDTTGKETIPLTPAQTAYVWIRAVGTTGLRQAWISLGSFMLSSVGTLGLLSFTNTANLFTAVGKTGDGPGTGPKINDYNAANIAQGVDNSSGDDTVFGKVVCLGLQTQEPHFKAFEIEMWDSTRTTLINTLQSNQATWDFGSDTWSQTDTIVFPHIAVGTALSFRGRVISSASSAASAWSAWADKTVGDTTAPSTTYTPVTTTRDAGGITITPTIGSLPVPDDTAYYDWFHTINSSPTPSAQASATKFKDQATNAAGTALQPFLQVSLQPGDTATVWIRSVDTSGNRQAWQPLGTFGITAGNVTGQSCTQQRYNNGKSIQVELDYGFTTPNDVLLAGVNVYLFNEGGSGKYRLVQKVQSVPLGAGYTGFVRVDGNPSGFSGAVKIIFVSVSTAGIESGPIASAPSVSFPLGLTGTYSGPAAVIGFSATQLGRSISDIWLESYDNNISQYNIARAQDGSHNSPGGSVLISAATYAAGVVTITTGSAHGLSGGETVMIFGAAGWTKLDGIYSNITVLTTTKFTANRTFFPIPPAYTPNSASMWGANITGTTVRQFTIPRAVTDPNNTQQGQLQQFQDQTFLPSEYVPGNPNRYYYFIQAQTADGLYSTWVRATAVELSVDAGATSNWNPVAAALNRLFNAQFLSNTTNVNKNLVAANNPSPADTTGQGTPPAGNEAWYGLANGVGALPYFLSNGSSGTGEIQLPASAANADLVEIIQKISSTRFAPGSSLCLSVYVRSSDVTKQNYQFGLAATRFNGNAIVDGYSTTFNASLIGTGYTRFDFEFKLSNTGWSAGGIAAGNFLQVEIAMITTSAATTPNLTFIKPMLNDGRAPGNWTPTQDTVDAPGVGVLVIALPPPTAVVPPSYSHKDPGVPVWGS